MVPAPMFAVLAEATARFPEQGHTLIVGLFLLLLGLVMGIGVAGFVLVIYSLRKENVLPKNTFNSFPTQIHKLLKALKTQNFSPSA